MRLSGAITRRGSHGSILHHLKPPQEGSTKPEMQSEMTGTPKHVIIGESKNKMFHVEYDSNNDNGAMGHVGACWGITLQCSLSISPFGLRHVK